MYETMTESSIVQVHTWYDKPDPRGHCDELALTIKHVLGVVTRLETEANNCFFNKCAVVFVMIISCFVFM